MHRIRQSLPHPAPPRVGHSRADGRWRPLLVHQAILNGPLQNNKHSPQHTPTHHTHLNLEHTTACRSTRPHIIPTYTWNTPPHAAAPPGCAVARGLVGRGAVRRPLSPHHLTEIKTHRASLTFSPGLPHLLTGPSSTPHRASLASSPGLSHLLARPSSPLHQASLASSLGLLTCRPHLHAHQGRRARAAPPGRAGAGGAVGRSVRRRGGARAAARVPRGGRPLGPWLATRPGVAARARVLASRAPGGGEHRQYRQYGQRAAPGLVGPCADGNGWRMAPAVPRRCAL
eukprot:362698-Chlamydomonas_euryale.AAC.1